MVAISLFGPDGMSVRRLPTSRSIDVKSENDFVGAYGAHAHIQYCKCPGARHRTAHSTLSRGSSHFGTRPSAHFIGLTTHSARPGPRSRAWHPRLYWPGGRRLRPESMGHCRPLSTCTHLGSPHSRAQRAPPPFRTCITCSCSWDRHEKGNPHAVYSRGQGGAARADAPSPSRALPAQCAHDSARRGGWNGPRLVMTRLISVFRVPFE